MVREFASGDTITAQRMNCYVRAIDNLCRQVRALQGGRATAWLGKVYHPRTSGGDGYAYVHRVPLNLRQFEYVGISTCGHEATGNTERVVLCGLVMRTSGTGDRTTVKTLAITELFTPLFMQGCKIGVRDCMSGEGCHYVPECVSVLAEKEGGQVWELCKKRICQMPSYFHGSYLRSQPYDFRWNGTYADIPSTDGNIAMHVQVMNCRWAIAGSSPTGESCVCMERCLHCSCFKFLLPCGTTPFYVAYAGYTDCYGATHGGARIWCGAEGKICLPMCSHAVFSTGRGYVCSTCVRFPVPEGGYVQSWRDSIFPVGYGYYSANHRRPIVRPHAVILSKPEWSVEYYSLANSVKSYPPQDVGERKICWQTYTCACDRSPLPSCKIEYVTQQDVYLSRSGFAPDSLFAPYEGGSE